DEWDTQRTIREAGPVVEVVAVLPEVLPVVGREHLDRSAPATELLELRDEPADLVIGERHLCIVHGAAIPESLDRTSVPIHGQVPERELLLADTLASLVTLLPARLKPPVLPRWRVWPVRIDIMHPEKQGTIRRYCIQQLVGPICDERGMCIAESLVEILSVDELLEPFLESLPCPGGGVRTDPDGLVASTRKDLRKHRSPLDGFPDLSRTVVLGCEPRHQGSQTRSRPRHGYRGVKEGDARFGEGVDMRSRGPLVPVHAD